MASGRAPFQSPTLFSNMTFEQPQFSPERMVDGSELTMRRHLQNEFNEGPVIFTCEKCRLPVGDSSGWKGHDYEFRQIILKQVTIHVAMQGNPRLLRMDPAGPCLVVELICKGCGSFLGLVYVSTPSGLDHRRGLFHLAVVALESYVVGSASQELPEDRNENLTEEGAAANLALRLTTYNAELTEMKFMVLSLASRLDEMTKCVQRMSEENQEEE